jgi:hypothetical protein
VHGTKPTRRSQTHGPQQRSIDLRNIVHEIPVTDVVIKAVENMALQQGFKSLQFKNQNGVIYHDADWIVGVDYDDPDDYDIDDIENEDEDYDNEEDEDKDQLEQYEELEEQLEHIDPEEITPTRNNPNIQ